MALASLSLVQIALSPPTAHDLNAAADAWRTFQWRWLQTYGTRTATSSQLFALAKDLFKLDTNPNERAQLVAFSRFLTSRERWVVDGWYVNPEIPGFRLMVAPH